MQATAMMMTMIAIAIAIVWMSPSFDRGVVGTSQQDIDECSAPVTKLLVCLPFVQGKAALPTPPCCAVVSDLFATNKKCLCVLIDASFTGGIPGLPPFNQTLAILLAPQCNVDADPGICPGLLGLSPSSPEAKEFIDARNLTSPPSSSSSPALSTAAAPNQSASDNTNNSSSNSSPNTTTARSSFLSILLPPLLLLLLLSIPTRQASIDC